MRLVGQPAHFGQPADGYREVELEPFAEDIEII
jgi:hypothetical protein